MRTLSAHLFSNLHLSPPAPQLVSGLGWRCEGVREVSRSDLQTRTRQEDVLPREDARLSPQCVRCLSLRSYRKASGSDASVLPRINTLPGFTLVSPCVCSRPRDWRRPCGRFAAVPGTPSCTCFKDSDHSRVITGVLRVKLVPVRVVVGIYVCMCYKQLKTRKPVQP